MILNSSAFAADVRYCGYVSRTIDGSIKRSTTTIRRFQALYPCPSTGKITGACQGWSKDHIVPLVCGGCDTVENMQWLPNTIKSCSDDHCKDRFEQTVYKTEFCK